MCSKKRPCSVCRRWFQPDARVGGRQHACSSPECQSARRKRSQRKWSEANPGYWIGYRIQQRGASSTATAPPMSASSTGASGDSAEPSSGKGRVAQRRPRVPPPLDRLPWDLAQDEFGVQGADFLGAFGRLLGRSAQDEMRCQVLEIAG